MKRYKEPDFQTRISAAADARTDVLEKLKTGEPLDPEVAAARLAAAEAREAAQLERRRLARLAAEERKAEKEAKALAAAAAKAAAQKPVLTEAERKAARDARYLARKNR